MPTVEFTSNSLYMSLPLQLQGNIGIGTSTTNYPLNIAAPLGLYLNQPPTVTTFTPGGPLYIRTLSTSSNGDTLVAGVTGISGNIRVFEYNNQQWSSNVLQIQDIPPGVYSGSYIPRGRSHATISLDGTRIVAVKGKTSGGDGNSVQIFHKSGNTWTSKAYIHHAGYLGWDCAISGDGNTVALTSPQKDQIPTANPSFPGAIYVYKYNSNNDTWEQSLYREYDNFTDQITLNQDGTLLAFSRTGYPAWEEDVNYNPSNASIHILKYTNGSWNAQNNDIIITPPPGLLRWHYYGKSVKFSTDGRTLAVAAPGQPEWWITHYRNNATYVYYSSDASWTSYTTTTLQPTSYASPTADDIGNYFGNTIAMNSDGSVIAIGAQFADTIHPNAGRVWIYQLLNGAWKIVNILDGTEQDQGFGFAVAITADASSVFVTARDYNIFDGQGLKHNFITNGMAAKSLGSMEISNSLTAGTLSITNNGMIEKDLYVNSRVGIGTQEPRARTHIYHIENSDIFRVDDSSLDASVFMINKDGNVGIGIPKPDTTLHIVGDTSIGYEYVYPPPNPANSTYYNLNSNVVDMVGSWYGNGRYVMSDSDERNPSTQPYYAFLSSYNTVSGSYNSTGDYLGVTSTTFTDFSNNVISLSGAWVQMQLPTPIILSSLTFTARVSYGWGVPSSYVLLGSSDGNSWNLVYDQRNPISIMNITDDRIVNITDQTTPYSYYRIVINTIYPVQNFNFVNIGNIRFFTKTTNHLQLYGNATVSGSIQGTYLIGDGSGITNIYTGWSSNLNYLYNTSENIGIGTTTPATALTVNGTIRNINGPSPTSGTSLVITGSGDIAPQSSDARYKNNIEDLPPVLDSLMNVRPVSYTWKDETTPWYGLLAQQVSQVFPDAAWHNEANDTYGVHYTPSIVTLLLKAIQELKTIVAAQNEEHNRQIQELRDMLGASN